MLKHRFIWHLAVPAFLMFSAAAMAGPNWLITPDEVARVQQDGDYKEPVAAVEGPGPQIVVKDPKALSRLTSPVDVFIAFEPGKSGLSPDMKTLNITLIGLFDIDITDRLREYIKGDNLAIDKADLPPGHHRLRMAIKDVKGNPNERDVVIVVMKK